MRRLIIIYILLGLLLIWAIALTIGMDIANANPVFRFIPKVQEKEVPVEKIVYVEKEVIQEVYWYQFKATGYSPNDPKQGTNRTMASGKEVYEGAIAVDPDVIPLGTKVEIKGLPNEWDGIYTAEDTGGAIKELTIDVFRENYFEAFQINCNVWIRILESEE